MITGPRLEAEAGLMANHHPHFQLFITDREVGFSGWLRGPQSGQWYATMGKAKIADYPQQEPAVYMKPQIGGHWWVGGRLCWHPDGGHWKPGQNTFAKAIYVAIEYLARFDR